MSVITTRYNILSYTGSGVFFAAQALRGGVLPCAFSLPMRIYGIGPSQNPKSEIRAQS